MATTETVDDSEKAAEQEQKASSLLDDTTPKQTDDAEESDPARKRSRVDPELVTPWKPSDLKPWDPTFYVLLRAEDYPD